MNKEIEDQVMQDLKNANSPDSEYGADLLEELAKKHNVSVEEIEKIVAEWDAGEEKVD